MIRNVIFDWSGTLVDDLPAVLQASNHVFRRAGIPELTLDEFRSEFCLPFKAFYDRYVPHVPLPRLEEWFHAEFRRARDSVRELPHARGFLMLCRENGLRTFVLSSVRRDHYRQQAELTGFAAFVDVSCVEVRDKRDRIRALLAEQRLAPRETLFIGDMEHDIETARHGGVWSCGVLTGYNGVRQLRNARPDVLVEHLGELGELLERRRFDLDGEPPAAAKLDEKRPVVTVGGLIFDQAGRVLLVRTHKWSDLWGIPGGKVRYGEPLEAALHREIEEETGLGIRDIEFVLVQDCIGSTEFYRDAHFVLMNYTCRRREGGEVRLNSEAQVYRWVGLRDCLAMALNQPTRILVEAVLDAESKRQ